MTCLSSSQSSQTVADLGEAHIIRRFSGSIPVLPEGTTGIGDDCAVIEGAGGQKRLVGTDLLVEEVHFRRGEVEPRDLGHKALAVNLSDIAAMGGTPDGFFLSLALPGSLPARWLDHFRDGILELARKFEVPLLGGDTTRSPGPVMISVTATGLTGSEHLKLRSSARPGDRLCVTGTLGDSAAGLAILTHPDRYKLLSNLHREPLVQQYCRPEPAVEQGRWLGRQPAVHALIDLSDGLMRDARHLAAQSDCSISLALDQLPLSADFEAFCEMDGSPERAQEQAAAGGEDYHLLLSVAEGAYDETARKFKERFGEPLHAVGSIEPGPPEIYTFRDGSPAKVHQQEFQHFNRP